MPSVFETATDAISGAPAEARQLGWLAFVGVGLSMATCYFIKLSGAVASAWGASSELSLNVHVQAALMSIFGLMALAAIWQDRRAHRKRWPAMVGVLGFAMIVGPLYIYYDPRFETLGYVLLLAAAFMNQQAVMARLNETVSEQAVQLASWNASLAERVDGQVAEIDRLARLKRFLAPEVADLVMSEGDFARLDSHRGFVACLFCDIRNFTALSEGVEPEEVMQVLQTFHQQLGKLVSQHDATIGYRSGDGFMVIVGDPVAVDTPSETALRLARAMMRTFEDLRREWARLGYDIGFGIGIASGYATLGIIGDEARFDYTAIGSPINLAARLCAAAGDGEILVNRRVYADVEVVADVRPNGTFEFKGFDRPVEAFLASVD